MLHRLREEMTSRERRRRRDAGLGYTDRVMIGQEDHLLRPRWFVGN